MELISTRYLQKRLKVGNAWVVRGLVNLSVKQLPSSERARYEEEWRGHIDEQPGEIGKFLTAVGVVIAAHKISAMLGSNRQQRALPRESEEGNANKRKRSFHEDFDLISLRSYAFAVVVLAIISLSLEAWIGHSLPATIHAEQIAPVGYMLTQTHFSLSETIHFANVVHTFVSPGPLRPSALRITVFLTAGFFFMYRVPNRYMRCGIRTASVLTGACAFSQYCSFLLYGGVIDFVVHTTRQGLFLSAMSLSDYYGFVGIGLTMLIMLSLGLYMLQLFVARMSRVIL